MNTRSDHRRSQTKGSRSLRDPFALKEELNSKAISAVFSLRFFQRRVNNEDLRIRLLMVCVVTFFVITAGISPSLGADDDIAATEVKVIEEENDVVHIHFGFDPSNFEESVFGGNPDDGRVHLAKIVDHRVKEFCQTNSCTDAQITKLKLAAHIALEKFDRDIAELRQEFSDTDHNEENSDSIFPRVQSLQERRRDLLHHDSFFSKVATAIVHEQKAAFRRATIQQVLSDIGNLVVLQPVQQDKLAKLLSMELQPPKNNYKYDDIYVKYQFSQLPEQTLRPLFDDEQWPLLRKTLDDFQNLRPELIRKGVLLRQFGDPIPDSKRTSRSERNRPADATRPENSSIQKPLQNRGVTNFGRQDKLKLERQRDAPSNRGEE